MLFLISELVIRICLVCENPMNYIFEVYIQFCCGIFVKTKKILTGMGKFVLLKLLSLISNSCSLTVLGMKLNFSNESIHPELEHSDCH